MRLRAAATAVVILLGAAAQAQPDKAQPDKAQPNDRQRPNSGQQQATQPAVGVGVICNTPEQAERFISLRAQGDEADNAIQSVNTEAKEARACGVAAIVFTRAAIVANKTLQGKLVQVVRINVMAGFDGSGWQRISHMTQYAVFEGGGETI